MIGVALASLIGCLSSQNGATEPTVTVGPDEFVMRDVRKDAAHRLGCQVPMVDTRMGAWSGSEGNVIAYGCGDQLHYYLRCLTNHQCSVSLAD